MPTRPLNSIKIVMFLEYGGAVPARTDIDLAEAVDRTPATAGQSGGARSAPRLAVPTDVHQHLWTAAFCDALARRTQAPRLTRVGARWLLHAAGEPAYEIDPRLHDPVARAEQAHADGIARILVAPSCPIGVESLPAHEAQPLLDAYHAGAAGLGDPFRAWAAASLAAPDPFELADRLAGGFVGLCLPAGALAVPAELWRIAPLLDVLEVRGAPLLVHPGPAPWAPHTPLPAHGPAWWAALTTYVTQMQTAWFVFHHYVREDFPQLRVCFAMLAGLAPLQADRLRSRGAQPLGCDGLTFLDTSSYGADIAQAVADTVGASAVVFGSDRPIVDTASTARDPGFTRDNAARLIYGEGWE